MTTVHNQNRLFHRFLASFLSTMWKSKRCLFLLILLVAGSFFAIYIIYGLDSARPNSHTHYHLSGDTALKLPTFTVQNLPRIHNSGRLQPNPEPDSAPKPLLRILVLTYKRAESLQRCLESINAAEYDGERVALEIHVDRGKDGKIHNKTLQTAKSFLFKHGEVKVFPRPRHGGVVGQWLSSWKVPQNDTAEIAVFVEDDLTLSPFFARWLRMVHKKYDGYPGINGYALQAETVRHASGTDSSLLKGPPGEMVFLYPILGSWGFSPVTGQWREFMRWYHEVSQDPKFLPLVPGLKPSGWFQDFVKSKRTETMWTMWHIYYATKNKQYTLYPHLPNGEGLSFNWKEPGEHYSKSQMGKGVRPKLLGAWPKEGFNFPEKLVIVDAKGKITGQKLSPSGLE